MSPENILWLALTRQSTIIDVCRFFNMFFNTPNYTVNVEAYKLYNSDWHVIYSELRFDYIYLEYTKIKVDWRYHFPLTHTTNDYVDSNNMWTYGINKYTPMIFLNLSSKDTFITTQNVLSKFKCIDSNSINTIRNKMLNVDTCKIFNKYYKRAKFDFKSLSKYCVNHI